METSWTSSFHPFQEPSPPPPFHSLSRVPVVRVLEQGHLLAPPVRLPDGEDRSGVELFVGGRDVVLDFFDVPPVGAPDQLPRAPLVAGPVLDVVDALGAGVRDHGLDGLGPGGVPAVLGRRRDVRGKLRGGGDAGDLFCFFCCCFVCSFFFRFVLTYALSVRFFGEFGKRRRKGEGVAGTEEQKRGEKSKEGQEEGSRSRSEFFFSFAVAAVFFVVVVRLLSSLYLASLARLSSLVFHHMKQHPRWTTHLPRHLEREALEQARERRACLVRHLPDEKIRPFFFSFFERESQRRCAANLLRHADWKSTQAQRRAEWGSAKNKNKKTHALSLAVSKRESKRKSEKKKRPRSRAVAEISRDGKKRERRRKKNRSACLEQGGILSSAFASIILDKFTAHHRQRREKEIEIIREHEEKGRKRNVFFFSFFSLLGHRFFSFDCIGKSKRSFFFVTSRPVASPSTRPPPS